MIGLISGKTHRDGRTLIPFTGTPRKSKVLLMFGIIGGTNPCLTGKRENATRCFVGLIIQTPTAGVKSTYSLLMMTKETEALKISRNFGFNLILCTELLLQSMVDCKFPNFRLKFTSNLASSGQKLICYPFFLEIAVSTHEIKIHLFKLIWKRILIKSISLHAIDS
jgi:hypothetical protein